MGFTEGMDGVGADQWVAFAAGSVRGVAGLPARPREEAPAGSENEPEPRRRPVAPRIAAVRPLSPPRRSLPGAPRSQRGMCAVGVLALPGGRGTAGPGTCSCASPRGGAHRRTSSGPKLASGGTSRWPAGDGSAPRCRRSAWTDDGARRGEHRGSFGGANRRQQVAKRARTRNRAVCLHRGPRWVRQEASVSQDSVSRVVGNRPDLRSINGLSGDLSTFPTGWARACGDRSHATDRPLLNRHIHLIQIIFYSLVKDHRQWRTPLNPRDFSVVRKNIFTDFSTGTVESVGAARAVRQLAHGSHEPHEMTA